MHDIIKYLKLPTKNNIIKIITFDLGIIILIIFVPPTKKKNCQAPQLISRIYTQRFNIFYFYFQLILVKYLELSSYCATTYSIDQNLISYKSDK